MSFMICPASDEREWDQAIELIKRVYVGEGYTTQERADGFVLRANFEAGGDMLLARSEHGSVIGTAVHLFDGGPLKQIALPSEAEFRMLAVAPEARGHGVGEALVEACVQRARDSQASAVVLWSQPSMKAAHRLYERLGFVRVPERDQDDPRGFTRLVFRKEF